jgi:hypothetical protein
VFETRLQFLKVQRCECGAIEEERSKEREQERVKAKEEVEQRRREEDDNERSRIFPLSRRMGHSTI